MAEQLSFFPPTREEKLENDIKILQQKYDRLVKSFHGKLALVVKQADESKHDIATLKAAMCRETLFDYKTMLG